MNNAVHQFQVDANVLWNSLNKVSRNLFYKTETKITDELTVRRFDVHHIIMSHDPSGLAPYQTIQPCRHRRQMQDIHLLLDGRKSCVCLNLPFHDS